MKMEVEVLSSKLIKPSAPTPPNLRNYRLSFFDQFAPPVYPGIIYFFPSNCEEIENKDVVRLEQLEKSLSEILTRFYPLAGKYMREDLLVDCNDQGVEVFEARVCGKLDELVHGTFEPKMLDRLVPNPGSMIGSVLSPVAAIQISVFDCGGVAVGMRTSHKIADGFTALTFIKEWAIASKEGVDKAMQPSFELASTFPARYISKLKPQPPPSEESGPNKQPQPPLPEESGHNNPQPPPPEESGPKKQPQSQLPEESGPKEPPPQQQEESRPKEPQPPLPEESEPKKAKPPAPEESGHKKPDSPPREESGPQPPPAEGKKAETLIARRFTFDGELIKILKSKATGPESAGSTKLKRQPSKVLVVTALIWRTLMQISQSKHKSPRNSLISIAMDLRERTGLPAPKTSFGNLFAHATARFKAEESNIIELHELVGSIKNAITDTAEDYANAQNADEVFNMLAKYYIETDPDRARDVDLYCFTSLGRFSCYEVDFGWGKPAWVTTTAKPVKLVSLMDTKCGDGIEAWVTMDEGDMAEFVRHPDIPSLSSLTEL